MLETSILNKLIEQGFIVLGIAIAMIMAYFFVKYIKQFSDSNIAMTEKTTTALVQAAHSNEKLSEVLDKNLARMDNVSTKDDIDKVKNLIEKKHRETSRKLDKINGEV